MIKQLIYLYNIVQNSDGQNMNMIRRPYINRMPLNITNWASPDNRKSVKDKANFELCNSHKEY